MSSLNKIVMCFGVFDLLHEGHRHFLTEAKKLGRCLIVLAAQDKAVALIKGRAPDQTLHKRMANLEKSGIADKVLAGDKKQGSWQCIHKHKPDVIAFGYDQDKLKQTLLNYLRENKLLIECVSISPYKSGKMHSKVIRRNYKL